MRSEKEEDVENAQDYIRKQRVGVDCGDAMLVLVSRLQLYVSYYAWKVT